MKHQRLELSTGTIDVFDDFIPLHLRSRMSYWLHKDCGYFMGWSDRHGEENHLHAVLAKENEMSGDIYIEIMKQPPLIDRLSNHIMIRNVVNLSHQSSIHMVHAHSDTHKVILYYAALEWEDHWEGETMFFAEDGEIEFVNKYVPGRVIVFDGQMPHSIRAPSHAGPQFRLTATWFMEKMNEPTTET